MTAVTIIVPNAVFFGGDVVQGSVEVSLDKEVKSKQLSLEFSAFEFTEWSAGKNTYGGTRKFLSHKIEFLGMRSKRGFAMIGPGVQRFPFAFLLPSLIPPSFKHPTFAALGKIEYNMQVDFICSGLFANKQCSKVIQVGGNLYDEVHFYKEIPITRMAEKDFMFLHGTLKAEVLLPKANFFEDETFPVQVTVYNNTSYPIKEIKIHQYQTIKFCSSHTWGKGYRSSHTFEPYLRGSWKREHDITGNSTGSVTIPVTLASTLPTISLPEYRGVEDLSVFHPGIIYVTNNLTVHIGVSFSLDLKVEVPITVMRRNPRPVNQVSPNSVLDCMPVCVMEQSESHARQPKETILYANGTPVVVLSSVHTVDNDDWVHIV